MGSALEPRVPVCTTTSVCPGLKRLCDNGTATGSPAKAQTSAGVVNSRSELDATVGEESAAIGRGSRVHPETPNATTNPQAETARVLELRWFRPVVVKGVLHKEEILEAQQHNGRKFLSIHPD